jgi:GTP-binding protein
VGKSSFVNSLLNNKKLARVSNTPGKTRLLNFFKIDDRWMLVDMPGYGYAKVSKTEQQRWGKAMAEFLEKREALRLAVVLLDIRHGPQPIDLETLALLRDLGLPRMIVLNKADKLSRSQQLRAVREASQKLALPPEGVLPYSCETHAGREEVLKALEPWVS